MSVCYKKKIMIFLAENPFLPGSGSVLKFGLNPDLDP